MRVAAEIALSKGERRRLETWASTRSTSVRLRERARIVLMAAEGMTNKAIAAELQVDANKVGRWRARVAKEGTSSIEKERPRGANHGGKNTKKQAQLRSEVVEATTQTTPNDATHWSCRSMARHLNTTHSFVNRVWRAHGLKPHLIRTFKLSNDPRFEEKLRDVVGLYLDPPRNAAVFSFDEKSQIQALDRTQPGLPMKKGRCATMTHDYKRHGTTTLFAALNMATGEVIGKTYRKHRHQEVLRFLREVEKTVPKEQEIHMGVPPKLIIFNGFLVGAGAQHCQGQIRQRDRFATTMTIPTRNGDFGTTRAGSEWPARRAHSTACPNA